MAYEKNRSDKKLKKEYKNDSKEYKKALKENTTYRKGVVRQEVGRDMARKYLSEAKRVKKQMDSNPSDKSLKRSYNSLMSKHDVSRAKARRAVEVSTNRMKKVRKLKSAATKTMKAATASAVIAGGVYGVNKIMQKRGHKGINSQTVKDWAGRVKKVAGLRKYKY